MKKLLSAGACLWLLGGSAQAIEITIPSVSIVTDGSVTASGLSMLTFAGYSCLTTAVTNSGNGNATITIGPVSGCVYVPNIEYSGTVTFDVAPTGSGITSLFASPPAIGGTAAAAGAFTTLSASSTVSGTGFSTYLASPPAIGGTTAAAGNFTTVTVTAINTTPVVSGAGNNTVIAGGAATTSGNGGSITLKGGAPAGGGTQVGGAAIVQGAPAVVGSSEVGGGASLLAGPGTPGGGTPSFGGAATISSGAGGSDSATASGTQVGFSHQN